MIQLHQAIYGDKDGAYALINSSFSKSDVPEKLSNSTDLTDRPYNAILKDSVITGFLRNGYFLLVKSFPDHSSGVRRGRLFSHALILEEQDFLKLKDITSLVPFLLDTINKKKGLESISINATSINSAYNLQNSQQLNCAINGLVEHVSFENTIVWSGEDGYFCWLSKIWQNLPKKMKLNLRLGVAFNPQKINPEILNLIYVYEEVKVNWLKTKFKIIESDCNEDLLTQSANLLSGDFLKSKELVSLINLFSLKVEELDDLRVLESIIPSYLSFEDENNIKELMNFVHLISNYSSNNNSANKEKDKILQAICEKITNARVDEIDVIGNPNWSGFNKAQEVITIPLFEWTCKNLMIDSNPIEKSNLLEKVFTKTTNNNWADEVIKKAFVSILSKWDKPISKIIWSLFEAKPRLVKKIGSSLPIESEEDLAAFMPTQLKAKVAKHILDLSKSNKWLLLHGIVTLQLYTPHEAFKKQLALDVNLSYCKGIEAMASKLSEVQVINTAIVFDDPRLLDIAGKLCIKQPGLLEHIDITNIGWQSLWLQIAKTNLSHLWKGINDPTKILYAIMDLLKKGGDFNVELLSKISTSRVNNLLNYTHRVSIWKHLPSSVRHNFLQATAVSMIEDLDNESVTMSDLEKPLKEILESPDFVKDLMKSENVDMQFKLGLFDKLSSLGESDLIFLIEENKFSNIEATVLGQRIHSHDYKRAAKSCYSLLNNRKDLKPAVKACSNKLNTLQRFNLILKYNFDTEVVASDEYWKLLKEHVIILYPKGPDQRGIWEAAGGNDSDLINSETGKKRWYDAIRYIKNGGKPKVKSLINEMLTEFPNDEKLKLLKKKL